MLKLKSNIDFEMCSIYLSKSDKHLKNEKYFAVFDLLKGLKHQTDYSIYIKNQDKYDSAYYKSCIDYIISRLKNFLESIKEFTEFKNTNKIIIQKGKSVIYMSIIQDINKVENEEVFKLLSKLYNILEFTNLEFTDSTDS